MTGLVTLRNPIPVNGNLPNAGNVTVNVDGHPCPFTAVLDTVAAGKKIELSADGGTLFFTPTYSSSHANQLIVSVQSPITHIKFTGTAGDAYFVL